LVEPFAGVELPSADSLSPGPATPVAAASPSWNLTR